MGLNLVRLAAKAIHINSQSGTLIGLNLARMALQAALAVSESAKPGKRRNGGKR